ncbi:hypothetical protein [Butyrivibrio sp. JL13D10]|uniref:hypothetical protein n=1 Tax=Butyrivibrio sp. JL13D10 TaxID=3236815 RepID=UPI0038B54B55
MTMKHIGFALGVCALMLFFAGCGNTVSVGNKGQDNVCAIEVASANPAQLYAGVWADIYE